MWTLLAQFALLTSFAEGMTGSSVDTIYQEYEAEAGMEEEAWRKFAAYNHWEVWWRVTVIYLECCNYCHSWRVDSWEEDAYSYYLWALAVIKESKENCRVDREESHNMCYSIEVSVLTAGIWNFDTAGRPSVLQETTQLGCLKMQQTVIKVEESLWETLASRMIVASHKIWVLLL